MGSFDECMRFLNKVSSELGDNNNSIESVKYYIEDYEYQKEIILYTSTQSLLLVLASKFISNHD